MLATKRLNAFTLVEVIVAIAISSIVVSIAGVALLMFQKQLKNAETNDKCLVEAQLFINVIQKDVDEAKKITGYGQYYTFEKDTCLVKYYFGTDSSNIIMCNGRRQLVKLSIAAVEPEFVKGCNLVEHLNIWVNIDTTQELLRFSKIYDAATLMEEQP